MLDAKKRRARQQLDSRLADPMLPTKLQPPLKGYIRAIREAIGMTAEQLGKRMNITQQNVTKLEQSETSLGIRLESLKKAADAMECQLVYGFVPKGKSLEQLVNDRAREIAEKALARIGHTMELENQAVNDIKQDLEVSYYITENLKDRDLWN